MKKKIILIILSVLLAVAVGLFIQKQTVSQKSPPASEEIVLFYGDTCPHCKEVEDYIAKNNIKDKINLVEKEVYQDQENARQLGEAAKKCGLQTDSVGVPFLFTEGKCFVGTPDVIAFLSQKAGITEAKQ